MQEVRSEPGQELPARTRSLAVLAALLGCQGLDEFRRALPEALEAGLAPFPWVLLERGSGRFFTNSPALDRALVLAEGLTEEDIARRTTPFWRVLSIVDPQPAPET